MMSRVLCDWFWGIWFCWRLLVVAALRLTIGETVYEGVGKVVVAGGGDAVPTMGAGVTVGFSWIVLGLAGLAVFLGEWRKGDWVQGFWWWW